jgi:peroxiredoxin Q/BCP
MLKVGDKLPQFEGTNQDGETVHSENLIGKKLVVFSIPKPILRVVLLKPAI